MGPPDSQSGKNHVAQKVTALRHAHGAHHRAENESGPQPLTLVAPACQHAPGHDAEGAGGMAADKGAVGVAMTAQLPPPAPMPALGATSSARFFPAEPRQAVIPMRWPPKPTAATMEHPCTRLESATSRWQKSLLRGGRTSGRRPNPLWARPAPSLRWSWSNPQRPADLYFLLSSQGLWAGSVRGRCTMAMPVGWQSPANAQAQYWKENAPAPFRKERAGAWGHVYPVNRGRPAPVAAPALAKSGSTTASPHRLPPPAH